MDRALNIETSNFDGTDYFAFVGKIDTNAEAQLMELPLKIRQPLVKFDFSKTLRIALYEYHQRSKKGFRMTGVLLLAELDK